MSRKLIIVFLITCSSFLSTAQEFAIKKIEITSESVILHYDLIDTLQSRTYTINIYSSNDNYLAPLLKIKGDAGLEVKPGVNKKITWSSREELGTSFQGDIELEIRGRVYIPFVKFDGFQDKQVIKRGKPKTITWSGSTGKNILNFTLYKDDNYVEVIPNVANSGSYDLTIPLSVKPGKGYYFLVSDSKNKDQMVKTNTFEVRRKVPLGLKLLPIVVIGAAIPLLLPEAGEPDVEPPPGEPLTKN